MSTGSRSSQAIQQVEAALAAVCAAYHRLVLVVGAGGSGKTSVLNAVADRQGRSVVNLNLRLAEKLVGLSGAERVRRVERLLEEAVNEVGSDILFLDNTEILFAVDLRLNPLAALSALSRTKTVVASWHGHVSGRTLTYARPNHPEWKEYRLNGTPAIAL